MTMDPMHFTSVVEDEEIKLVIKPESLEAQRRCDHEYSVAFVEAIQRRIPPKSVLEKLLRDQGMWTEKDDEDLEALRTKIVKLEVQLGETKTTDQGLPLATQLATLRGQLVEITQQRGEVLNNSADFMAEQVRRDAFIAYSTFYADTGKLVFDSYEDFVHRASEPVAVDAKQVIARAMFKEFGEFMDGLPEAKFRNVSNEAVATANEELKPARKAKPKKAKKKAVKKTE